MRNIKHLCWWLVQHVSIKPHALFLLYTIQASQAFLTKIHCNTIHKEASRHSLTWEKGNGMKAIDTQTSTPNYGGQLQCECIEPSDWQCSLHLIHTYMVVCDSEQRESMQTQIVPKPSYLRSTRRNHIPTRKILYNEQIKRNKYDRHKSIWCAALW